MERYGKELQRLADLERSLPMPSCSFERHYNSIAEKYRNAITKKYLEDFLGKYVHNTWPDSKFGDLTTLEHVVFFLDNLQYWEVGSASEGLWRASLMRTISGLYPRDPGLHSDAEEGSGRWYSA